jgi:hydrogenase expression/formation protein HypC
MCLAVPAEVIALEGKIATISIEGALRQVDVSLVEEVALGEYVLVHAGFALHRWDRDDFLAWQEIQSQMRDAAADRAAADSASAPGPAGGDSPGAAECS